MNILITGVAGFIGSHLAERLTVAHTIIGVDNFCDYYSPVIKRMNISKLVKLSNFVLIESDIRDLNALDDCFSSCDIDLVIHLAAMAGIRPSIIDPVLYTEVNINGTVNMLEMCKKYKIKKFIFASSSSVYGNNRKVPFSEDDSVDHPISPYAATKKAGELICHTYHHLEDISTICLRFFTVYGPRQRPDLAIHKFTDMIFNNLPITAYGDGTSKRDYTFIEDIIDGIENSIKLINQANIYEIINLGESQTISLSEMISTIENIIGIKAQKIIQPMQPGDVDQTYADITKAGRIINYHPETKFIDGISKFIKWYKEFYKVD